MFFKTSVEHIVTIGKQILEGKSVSIGGFAVVLSNGYSPANLANSSTRPFSEMCETRQTRRHSPSRVARTRQTRRHSPSRVARTRQTRRHSPSRVARTRQTRERRVWRGLREFSESGEFGECRLDPFIHIKYVICAKNDLSYHACLC